MSESKKKKWDDLKKPFAKSVVKKNPAGFGDYVPHHIYTRRLVESGLFDSVRLGLISHGERAPLKRCQAAQSRSACRGRY